MDIDEYLDEIDRLWPEPGELPTRELLDLCQEAVDAHPESSDLWYCLGFFMQCSEDYDFSAEDYARCFRNAIEYDPNDARSHRELGYVLDVYFDDFEKAEQEFKKAIELEPEHQSYYGYARVLAQMGKTNDAINSLSETACPFHNHPDIQKLRTEIIDGLWEPVDDLRE